MKIEDGSLSYYLVMNVIFLCSLHRVSIYIRFVQLKNSESKYLTTHFDAIYPKHLGTAHQRLEDDDRTKGGKTVTNQFTVD